MVRRRVDAAPSDQHDATADTLELVLDPEVFDNRTCGLKLVEQ